mmetsp:Transcript_25293/g.42012  ORF Transcript_25293/g.42012 Transcript_25293/m.42012 type:complete len:203 (-) Transcript_25293:1477-2085(-)
MLVGDRCVGIVRTLQSKRLFEKSRSCFDSSKSEFRSRVFPLLTVRSQIGHFESAHLGMCVIFKERSGGIGGMCHIPKLVVPATVCDLGLDSPPISTCHNLFQERSEFLWAPNGPHGTTNHSNDARYFFFSAVKIVARILIGSFLSLAFIQPVFGDSFNHGIGIQLWRWNSLHQVHNGLGKYVGKRFGRVCIIVPVFTKIYDC